MYLHLYVPQTFFFWGPMPLFHLVMPRTIPASQNPFGYFLSIFIRFTFFLNVLILNDLVRNIRATVQESET